MGGWAIAEWHVEIWKQEAKIRDRREEYIPAGEKSRALAFFMHVNKNMHLADIHRSPKTRKKYGLLGGSRGSCWPLLPKYTRLEQKNLAQFKSDLMLSSRCSKKQGKTEIGDG